MQLDQVNQQLKKRGLPEIAAIGAADEPSKGMNVHTKNSKTKILTLNAQIGDAKARLDLLRTRFNHSSLPSNPKTYHDELTRRYLPLNAAFHRARKQRSDQAWTLAFSTLAIHACAIEHQAPILWASQFIYDIEINWNEISPQTAKALVEPIMIWSHIEGCIQPSASVSLLIPFTDEHKHQNAAFVWNRLVLLSKNAF